MPAASYVATRRVWANGRMCRASSCPSPLQITPGGIFGGIFSKVAGYSHNRRASMNSVGGPEILHKVSPASPQKPRHAWLCGVFCCELPPAATSGNNPRLGVVLGVPQNTPFSPPPRGTSTWRFPSTAKPAEKQQKLYDGRRSIGGCGATIPFSCCTAANRGSRGNSICRP